MVYVGSPYDSAVLSSYTRVGIVVDGPNDVSVASDSAAGCLAVSGPLRSSYRAAHASEYVVAVRRIVGRSGTGRRGGVRSRIVYIGKYSSDDCPNPS